MLDEVAQQLSFRFILQILLEAVSELVDCLHVGQGDFIHANRLVLQVAVLNSDFQGFKNIDCNRDVAAKDQMIVARSKLGQKDAGHGHRYLSVEITLYSSNSLEDVLEVLLGRHIHLLLRSKHISDEVKALFLQLLCVLDIEEAVVDKRQVERSLDNSSREAHEVRDQMLLHIVRSGLNQVLIGVVEEHVEIAQHHLIDEGGKVKVVEVEHQRLHQWNSHFLSHSRSTLS